MILFVAVRVRLPPGRHLRLAGRGPVEIRSDSSCWSECQPEWWRCAHRDVLSNPPASDSDLRFLSDDVGKILYHDSEGSGNN